MFDFAAVCIENTIAEIDIRIVGFFDDQNLVGTDAESPVGDKAELFGGQVNRLSASVQYDEIVACAMHFREFQFHLWCPADWEVVKCVREKAYQLMSLLSHVFREMTAGFVSRRDKRRGSLLVWS